MTGTVEAVHRSASHTLKKPAQLYIQLLAGLGVEGDAHMGETVKHRSRVRRDPTQPNLRQVHLIHSELYDELRAAGVDVLYDDRDQSPGVKFADADLLGVPTQLILGAKGLARGVVERKDRRSGERDEVALDAVVGVMSGG